jgi:hypothetical protein
MKGELFGLKLCGQTVDTFNGLLVEDLWAQLVIVIDLLVDLLALPTHDSALLTRNQPIDDSDVPQDYLGEGNRERLSGWASPVIQMGSGFGLTNFLKCEVSFWARRKRCRFFPFIIRESAQPLLEWCRLMFVRHCYLSHRLSHMPLDAFGKLARAEGNFQGGGWAEAGELGISLTGTKLRSHAAARELFPKIAHFNDFEESNNDIETLRALAQRQKAIQIAKELGRSYGATVVKAHQLGISLKFQPEHATRTDPLDESATNWVRKFHRVGN